MQFHFVAMNADYVRTITENWHYPGEYRFYDYARSEFIRDPENWGVSIFAVLDENNELVGEFTVWFEDLMMWIGFGLKPELTGRGLGQEFVSAGIQFAVDHFHYRENIVLLSVAAFNQRAIKVYRKLGFEAIGEYIEVIDEQEHKFIKMRMDFHKS